MSSLADRISVLENNLAKAMTLINTLTGKQEALENPSTTFKYKGVGVVLEDKNDGSKNILVHLQEEFPTAEGDISPLHTNTEYSGVDMHGVAYKHVLQSNTGIKAIWKETPNRLTAPDVRAGQQVDIYQVGDGDMFYWEELGRTKNLKRAERALYGWNASGADITADDSVTDHNHYTMDVNAKGGNITLLTSKNNGEYCGYTIQLDTKNGHVLISDDIGNVFNLDSKKSNLLMQSAKGGTVSIKGPDVILQGKALIGNFETISLAGKTLIKGDTTINGDTLLEGNTQITKETTTTNINNSGNINTSTLGTVPLSSYKHS